MKLTNIRVIKLERALDACVGADDHIRVISKLAATRHPEAIDVLCTMLGCEGPIGRAAARGLVKFGDAVVPAMIERLEEPDRDVRANVRDVLYRLRRSELYIRPPPTEAELLARASAVPLERIDPFTLERLAQIPSAAAAPLFERILREPRCPVCLRIDAATGLAALGRKEAVPLLIEIVQAIATEADLRKECVRALARLTRETLRVREGRARTGMARKGNAGGARTRAARAIARERAKAVVARVPPVSWGESPPATAPVEEVAP